MKFNDPSMQWTLYYNTTLADFVYAPFRYRSCLAPTRGIFSCTAVVRFSKQTRVTTQKSALMSPCRRLIGCQLGSKLSVGLNLRAWWFMAWHFSKVELGAKPLKWWELKGVIHQKWGQRIEGSRARGRGRERKREKGKKREDLSWLSWAFWLQLEGAHEDSSCAAKWYPSFGTQRSTTYFTM